MTTRFLRRLMAAIGGRDAAGVDEPLRIEYRHIQALSAIGNRRVRIDPDGKVFSDVVTRDCPRGTHWSGPWPEQPIRVLSVGEMRRLRAAVDRSGFFALPERIEQAGHDGYRDELDVVIGDRRHTVVVERHAPPKAFWKVRSAVLAALH